MDKNESLKKEEQDTNDQSGNHKNPETGFTEVKNASASGLGSMGKNAEEPTSTEKRDED